MFIYRGLLAEGPTSQEPPGEGLSCTGQGTPCEGPPWFIYINIYISCLYIFIYRGLLARGRLVGSLLARGFPVPVRGLLVRGHPKLIYINIYVLVVYIYILFLYIYI
jgi:hypothetical protein